MLASIVVIAALCVSAAVAQTCGNEGDKPCGDDEVCQDGSCFSTARCRPKTAQGEWPTGTCGSGGQCAQCSPLSVRTRMCAGRHNCPCGTGGTTKCYGEYDCNDDTQLCSVLRPIVRAHTLCVCARDCH